MAALPAMAADEKCCFTNQAYSGVCEVTPAQDETCKSILDYLNTPNSAGKAYCGGTNIRGGWASAACKASESQANVAHRGDRQVNKASSVRPAPVAADSLSR
jgi:hypothetical protein